MADFQTRYMAQAGARTTDMSVDAGLRSFMLGIYNRMAAGVALTGVVAVGLFALMTTSEPTQARIASDLYLTQLGLTLWASPLKWALMFAPLAFVLVLSFGIQKLSASTANMVFFLFSAVMGASISWILLAYTAVSVGQTFFAAAAAFGALSLYGYTTKRDLSGFGSFLIMGVVGLIIAGLVNMFLQSSVMSLAISAIGVLIFAGLTAYDTQRLKNMYYEVGGHGEVAAKVSVMGALSLYLDFINLFMFLLRFMGQARE